MDSIQLDRIASVSRVLLESPKAHMSTQYLCGTSRPDTSHIIHELCIRDGNGEIQRGRDLIDCGAMSIFMALRVRKRRGLADEPAYVTTLGLNGPLMAHASESRKSVFMVQYIEHFTPVQEAEVLVMPMRADDLVWDCLGSSPGILTSIGKAVDFWLWEPQVQRKWWQWNR